MEIHYNVNYNILLTKYLPKILHTYTCLQFFNTYIHIFNNSTVSIDY